MKKRILQIGAGLISLIFFYIFLQILLIYNEPMKNISLDLTLGPQGEGAFEQDFDEKGWEIFIQEGETVTELEPNGYGDYQGITPGQTFYYSRTLDIEIDNPTLQLGPVGNTTFSVFLDDTLIYTDYPESDNRIGYLNLPTSDIFRDKTLTITLPQNYFGKTLTIAQSTPLVSDAFSSHLLATPVPITLYCGYAYESSIISESFDTAIQATSVFFIGILLLIAFCLTLDLRTLFLSLAPFLWMFLYLRKTSFFVSYFDVLSFDIDRILYMLIGMILLLYLCLHGKKYRIFTYLLPITNAALLIAYYIFTTKYTQTIYPHLRFLKGTLQDYFFIFSLLFLLLLGLFLWQKESFFYRLFLPLFFGASLVYWPVHLMTDSAALKELTITLQNGQMTYLYQRVLSLLTFSTILTVLIEAIHKEILRRTELHLLKERQTLALESYEGLKIQHQEVLMLRHDMNKHFHLLHQMQSTEQMKHYLEELIGKNEKIRSVVQSGNEILDIIINGKMNTALQAGIRFEVEKAEVPAQLPLTNSDLSSLLMNIIDNALTAAEKSGLEKPYLYLNIHVKNNFLSIVCENSADTSRLGKKTPTVPFARHGLGLKIIRSISERYEGIVDTEYGKNYYRVQIAIPID